MRKLLLLALAGCALWACSDRNDLLLSLDPIRGTITGLAFVDLNGDGSPSAGEAPVSGVQALVVVEGTQDTAARATTDAAGAFVMQNVPIGSYRLLVKRTSALGDTLEILPLDSARLVLAAGDTITRLVRLGFPRVSAAELAQLPTGRRVALEGIALNGWSSFGDSTVHLTDATGSVRALRTVPGSFAAGDSVRVLGAVGLDAGRAVLVDAAVRVLVAGRGLPPLLTLSTVAAAAGQGNVGYGQVRISDAVIMDTASSGSDRRLTVDDGSGPLTVLLDGDVGFSLPSYVPGASLEATGVLVPAAGGGWQLKPRSAAEASLSFPTITIAEARASQPGRRVVLEGVALNAAATFGDSTVHVRDRTGAIRALRVAASIAGGDSVRILGTMTVRDGQPAVSVSGAGVILRGVGVGEPDSVSTRLASTANGGLLDAAQVRLAGTIIGTQNLPNGDFLVTVDDGSGPAGVLFDRDVPIPSGPYQPGALITARGVLAPTGQGSWQLLPRGASDVSATFSSVTIGELPGLPAGKRVYIHGIALNGWSTFGDSTVHVSDRTGAVRVLRLPSSLAFAGDSVRVLGTVALANGRTVLLGSGIEVLRAGVGGPVPDSLSTLAAVTALAGARDAALVRISGRIAAVQISPTGDTHVALNDGTGAVGVRLDRDAGFAPGSFQAGDRLAATGVLVPDGFPTFWLLKPRSQNDVAITPGGGQPITSFRTTWREYLSGQQPGGWTPRWDRSTSFLVLDEPTTRDGRVLQWSGSNLPRDRWALGFDGFGDVADQDVYTEFRIRSLGGALQQYLMGSVAVRLSGSAAEEAGYAVFFRQDGTVRDVVLATFKAGALVELAAASLSWSEDTWYSVRLEAVGAQIRARVWVRGEPEPGDWQLSASDSGTASGRPGVANPDVGVVQWEVWEARRR